MTLQSMTRRLDRLGGGPGFDLAEALEAAAQRVKEWHDAGSIGPMPREALSPPPENGTRAARKMWRLLAEGHARVILMPNGEFDELQAAYAMSDADLWRTVSQRERAGGRA